MKSTEDQIVSILEVIYPKGVPEDKVSQIPALVRKISEILREATGSEPSKYCEVCKKKPSLVCGCGEKT